MSVNPIQEKTPTDGRWQMAVHLKWEKNIEKKSLIIYIIKNII